MCASSYQYQCNITHPYNFYRTSTNETTAYILAIGNADEIDSTDSSVSKVYLHIDTLLALLSSGDSQPSGDFSCQYSASGLHIFIT